MSEKLNIDLEINQLQLNFVDLLMQSNSLKEKYEAKKDKYLENTNLETTTFYKASLEEINELQEKFNSFKQEQNANNKLDLYKVLSEEFDFIQEDINLIKSFEYIEPTKEIFEFNLVKLIFIEKKVELITQILVELSTDFT